MRQSFFFDPGDKSVGIFCAKQTGHLVCCILIKFGFPERANDKDGADLGALSVSSDHLLAVGAPGSTPSLDHSDSPVGNTGSVFIYRLIAVSHGGTPRLAACHRYQPPTDYMPATSSKLGSPSAQAVYI